ncbi:MAG: outer membrane protein [Fibrobacteres bacterium]|nr:outer membrane protein [Fibrobacterota bacterium]
MRGAILPIWLLVWAASIPVPAQPSAAGEGAIAPVRSGPAPAESALARAIADGHLRAATGEDGRLVPGPSFTFGEIRAASAPGFTTADLGISAFAGEPATAANLKAIGDRVRAFLLDHGHPFASVAIDFAVGPDPDKAVADLQISIDAGDGYKFGGFKHSGGRTAPATLDRLSLLRYGETYSETRLRLSAERLSRTGYFEAVVPGALFRDSTRNLLYPTLALTDLKGNRLSGILGYDSEKKGGGGVNGYMDIHLINLRGTARDLDFTFDSKQIGEGTASKEARFAYTEPWLLSTHVGAHIDLSVSLEDSVYDERNGELTLFQDLDFHSRYLVAFARQFNHDFLNGARTDADIAGLGFQYDARDQVPATLKGARYSLRLNGVHRDLGDSAYYLVQSINQLALWHNLGRWVGHALFSGSGNWPLEGRANRGELYALGGANTVRGFREREFLTNLFLYGNFELQFLLAPRSRASVFVVPAFINRLGGDVYWRRVVGYGLGLESGAKDWTFGISYALNPDRDLGDGFVHLRVTNNF